MKSKELKMVHKLLNETFWLETLKSKEFYTRVEDDCGGDLSKVISVIIGEDGDVWVDTLTGTRRFRTYCGGGRSLRVRNALMILAEAIRLDNEEKPI